MLLDRHQMLLSGTNCYSVGTNCYSVGSNCYSMPTHPGATVRCCTIFSVAQSVLATSYPCLGLRLGFQPIFFLSQHMYIRGTHFEKMFPKFPSQPLNHFIYGMELNNMTVGLKTPCFWFLLPDISRIPLLSDHQN